MTFISSIASKAYNFGASCAEKASSITSSFHYSQTADRALAAFTIGTAFAFRSKIIEIANHYIPHITKPLFEETNAICSHPLLQQPCQILNISPIPITPLAENSWDVSKIFWSFLGWSAESEQPTPGIPFMEALQTEALSLPSNLLGTASFYPYSAAFILGISALTARSNGKLRGAQTLATLTLIRALTERYGFANVMTSYGIFNSYRNNGFISGSISATKVVAYRLAYQGFYMGLTAILGPQMAGLALTALCLAAMVRSIKRSYNQFSQLSENAPLKIPEDSENQKSKDNLKSKPRTQKPIKTDKASDRESLDRYKCEF